MSPEASLVTPTISETSQVPNNLSSGTQIGESTSSLVGFYGATPIAQGSSGATLPSTTSATTSSPWGFATSTQANAIVSMVNGLQAALVAAGIISS